MRKIQTFSALFALLGTVSSAQALTIQVPLDAESWFKYPPISDPGVPGQVGSDMGTLTNNPQGHLVATKTTATGGTNWFLGRDTVDTYDLQDATLHYQWRVNGQGSYAGTFNGLLTGDHNGLAYYKPMTTGWSFNSSLLIPSDTWLYTEYKFSEVGKTWEYSIGTGAYGAQDIAHGTLAMAATSWTALATARPFIWLGDNYVAGAYFELAEMTIETSPVAIPEPGTYALLLAGLAATGMVVRRRLG
jgi:PEP-CTERM motif